MLGSIFTWALLAAGSASSAYLDVALAGQPEQLWAPVLNMALFAAACGYMFEV